MNKADVVKIVEPASLVAAPLPSVSSSDMANGVVAWGHSNGHAPGKSNGKQSIHFASNEGHKSSFQPMNGSEIDSGKDFEIRNTLEAGSSYEEQISDLTQSNGTKGKARNLSVRTKRIRRAKEMWSRD